jgi:hypothetical protein
VCRPSRAHRRAAAARATPLAIERPPRWSEKLIRRTLGREPSSVKTFGIVTLP